MIRLINKSRFKIKNMIESMYIPMNDTWGWFVDTDTVGEDTDTVGEDTDTVGVTDIIGEDTDTGEILSINSYKSINNLNDYDCNPKMNNKYKSNDKFNNDNESLLGLCVVGSIFVCTTGFLFCC